MNGQILCIGGDVARWAHCSRELEANGYTVVHASDEWEASALLKTCPVHVICIDSRIMTESGGLEIAAGLKNVSQRVPVVLVQAGNDMPVHFEERVDVVIDDSTFSSVGQWLIEELRESSFPMFVELFEANERSGGNRAALSA